MGAFYLVYDSTDSDIVKMAGKRAGEIGATPVGASGLKELKTVLLPLRNLERMLVYTHGDPGGVKFGTSYLTARSIQSDFSGGGFSDLFGPDAKVVFAGCAIANVKDGCEIPAACSETENGVVFLKAFAQSFLLKKGGRAVGSTSAGFGFPIWGSKIYHLTGTTVYAMANVGKHWYGGIRLATGAELATPCVWGGNWRVWDGKEFFYYHFSADSRQGGAVYWVTPQEFRNSYIFVDLADRRGSWSTDSDYLKITWPTEAERWDMPLFSGYQTGISFGNTDFAMPGLPGQGGIGDVWAEAVTYGCARLFPFS